MALFSVVYFLSVLAGESLYGSLAVPSPFWFPDSILLCALLLTPKNEWWFWLLAMWPLRLVAGAPLHTPVWFLLFGIANDSLKALFAAWWLDWLVPERATLSTLRALVIFLGVATLATPLLSALLAAPARHALGDPLWGAGYRWFLGDAVAQVIVTPTLLFWCARGYRRVRGRAAEFVVVTVGLVAVLYYAFVLPHQAYSAIVLYAPVPFLLWAAVRLGPFGAANAMSLLAASATFGAVKGTGIFAATPTSQDVLAMQLFLLLLGVSMLGLAVSVDERETRTRELKLAERHTRELGVRLIHAQEEEGARIARELHDDVGQRLALVVINAQRLRRGATELTPDANRELNAIVELTTQLSSDIHHLSHRLHPSILDSVGLVGALRGLCEEIGQQAPLSVTFVANDVPEPFPTEISTAFFRIAQEGLRNVVKHSAATQATVELSVAAGRLELCISDTGIGFEADAPQREPGLGLISIRERLRSLGGALQIQSSRGSGTRIHAAAPVPLARPRAAVNGRPVDRGIAEGV